MSPLPVIVTAGVIAIIPPLRRRVVPVAKATLEGSLGVVGAALGAAIGMADAAINGPEGEPTTD